MSMYNMMNGANPATFLILPMLGKHPDEYPRFRDCFVDENNLIEILTRTGGNNRNDYAEEHAAITNMPNYVRNHDSDEDNTYAIWYFNVPTKWENDFDTIMNGDMSKISIAYLQQLKKVFPKLTDKFDELLAKDAEL